MCMLLERAFYNTMIVSWVVRAYDSCILIDCVCVRVCRTVVGLAGRFVLLREDSSGLRESMYTHVYCEANQQSRLGMCMLRCTRVT